MELTQKDYRSRASIVNYTVYALVIQFSLFFLIKRKTVIFPESVLLFGIVPGNIANIILSYTTTVQLPTINIYFWYYHLFTLGVVIMKLIFGKDLSSIIAFLYSLFFLLIQKRIMSFV